MKKKKKIILLAILAVIVAIGGLGIYSGVNAKYKKQVMVTDEVNYYNRLAESFTLTESLAETSADGQQSLSGDSSTANHYMLIPGTEVAQNPHFEIKNRSSLDAMLFMEVEGTPIGAEIDDTKWELLDGLTGANNGAVYVYRESLNDSPDGNYDIPALVSTGELSNIPSEIGVGDGFCRITGYLVQVTDSTMSPAEIYTERVLN